MATCASKKRYPTRKIARHALKRMQGAHGVCLGCHAYPCKECGFFHLGHLSADIKAGLATREVYG